MVPSRDILAAADFRRYSVAFVSFSVSALRRVFRGVQDEVVSQYGFKLHNSEAKSIIGVLESVTRDP
jgi:hypothetical protein